MKNRSRLPLFSLRPIPPDTLLEGLPPILDAAVKTLILGSFPSPASLAARNYYAHRQNQFWRIMSDLLGEALTEFDYPDKRRGLLRHGIGVWDVYRRCAREGALDSAITSAEPNDFSVLRKAAPCIKRVCFNGKTSGKFERWFSEQAYATCVLPSTSPAYTLKFEEKKRRWREGIFGA
ncbi:MAG: DNA-deoxyinosine glycosylase [Candidatus Accumulibacter sp.]|nr:DNA-deoxyinosine glycosylase [Accumulibacter sp.]